MLLYHFRSHHCIVFSVSVSPCQRINSILFPGIELWIKRDDLLHPQVSGNKFRKLKYPLLALAGQRPHLVSMGGLWSNHIHALAHAAAIAGYPATALIRAAEGMDSAMLDDCRALGMQIIYVNRETYRALRDDGQHWRRCMCDVSEQHVWLPEGGSSPAALHGVAELVAEVRDQIDTLPDVFMLACGTGATLAGIVAGTQGHSQVLGVAAIKNGDYLNEDIRCLLQKAGYPAHQNYHLLTNFHHGGYAKISTELIAFCDMFQHQTGIALEPVYTGKMLFALHRLCLENYFPAQTRVVAVHTGGLQGKRGFPATIVS
ncbi:1-aminocyclopropane-1-carboxylate deaminase/D-cysteine desulfhydrase [Undibacterium sp. RuRC25W]|uniref:1-aminocyclopropane-1-carboxylate deaminase/D-cysteine desulfhydrase n=1 Tax=Undibacterium sp. RuRC25W TaxID=3413047 RepID=UPI003BF1F564